MCLSWKIAIRPDRSRFEFQSRELVVEDNAPHHMGHREGPGRGRLSLPLHVTSHNVQN